MLDWYGHEQSECVDFDSNIEANQCENVSTCEYEGLYIWKDANMMRLFEDMQMWWVGMGMSNLIGLV